MINLMCVFYYPYCVLASIWSHLAHEISRLRPLSDCFHCS